MSLVPAGVVAQAVVLVRAEKEVPVAVEASEYLLPMTTHQRVFRLSSRTRFSADLELPVDQVAVAVRAVLAAQEHPVDRLAKAVSRRYVLGVALPEVKGAKGDMLAAVAVAAVVPVSVSMSGWQAATTI